MKSRFKMQEAAPEGYNILLQMEALLRASSLNKTHQLLIQLRSSQINGCAFCLHLHTQEAIKMKEDMNRIVLLNAWQEAGDFFTAEERAVLALTEAVTSISEKAVTDAVYNDCISFFGESYTAHLILAIVTINSWNRIARSSLTLPGEKLTVQL